MSLARIITLAEPDEVREYKKFKLELLEMSFSDLITQLLSQMKIGVSWKLEVIIQTLNETHAVPDPRDFEKFSFLCSTFPEIASAIHKQVVVFWATVPTIGLLEWYESVSRRPYLHSWLINEIYLEIVSRMQALTIHNDTTWFEELAERVIKDNYLPSLVPAVKTTCLKLSLATQEAVAKPRH